VRRVFHKAVCTKDVNEYRVTVASLHATSDVKRVTAPPKVTGGSWASLRKTAATAFEVVYG